MLGFNGGTIGIANTVFTGTKSDDPNYSSVSLLLNGNGTNGSTTFTDSSVNNHTITRNGNAQISTTQSKFGGSSIYFDGNGDYLTATDSSFAFGTGEFTIEFWMRAASTAVYEGVLSVGNVNTNNSWQISGGTDLAFYKQGGLPVGDTFPSLNTWHHVAIVRDASSVVTMYINGTNVDSATDTNDYSANNLKIGTNRNVNGFYDGYIDDLRITKGVARYTSNFTPPTAQLPGEETGTFASGLWTSSDHIKQICNELWPGFVPSIVTDGLVLHLDAGDTDSYPGSGTTWTDLSGNGNNGTLVSMDGNNYSSANGGYLDFDGSSDYVQGTISSSTFTGPHSICCWFYRQTVKQWSALFSNNVNTNSCSILTFIDTSNSLGINQSGINATSIAAVDLGADHLNKWIYGVITFGGVSNGSAVNVYAYKDGSLLTNSGSLYWNMSSSSSYYVGRHWASTTEVHDGFISQVTIYNKALTSSEVTQNFDALKGRYGL